jgi:rare lipoprotein A
MLICGCAKEEAVSGDYPKTGLASWYSTKKTASGEKFDSSALTCAMRIKDFGRHYRVCNLSNDKCVVVRHNDFGPSARLYTRGRIIDLTKTAFLEIASLKDGVVRVTVSEVNNPD